MFQILKDLKQVFINYVRLYPSVEVFLEHKVTHFGLGFLVALLLSLTRHPFVGIGLVFILAIGKEIMDHADSYDPISESYQYDAPLYAHIFDIIITVTGAVAGAGVFLLSTL